MADLPEQVTVARGSEETKRSTVMVDCQPVAESDECCSLISLKTGCLIFAYFYLGYVLFNLTLSASILFTDVDTSSKVSDLLCVASIRELVLDPIPVVIHLFTLPFCVLLLFGLHKEKSTHIEIFMFFQLVCGTLTVLHRIIALSYANNGHATWITVMLAYIAWNIFFIFVLRNQVVQMRGAPPTCRLGQACTAESIVPDKVIRSKNTSELALPHYEPRLVLQQCCFCCIPLRTGSLILAYLYLIGIIVNCGMTAATMITFTSYLAISSSELKLIFIKIIIILAFTLVINLVALPFNIYLLVGLHKERQRYVRIYIIFQIVFSVLTVLRQIVAVSMSSNIHIYGILQLVGHLVTNVYYLLVLRSHYLKMAIGTDQPAVSFRDDQLAIAQKEQTQAECIVES
ncbi:uncharacterized protein LOC112054418 isoform X1 [Bicyclus anynana]|uniref:Uncharacterized protein LOC112054418 isoform X1 n=1 Tax=Bicyclus anynana TaxID=110368 RepID=A0ABM3LSE3_BICAN|nr:uncharacterized protein LOC112054418 isoform X1 [Bicyclus anynana]